MTRSIDIPIEDPSAVGEARRFAQGYAHGLGFDATETGKVALIVTELAGNIVKHAVRGEMVFRRLRGRVQDGIEVLALDRGPGMNNVAECMRDGYSTAGSPGTGLGAVNRLAHRFEIYSGREVGTVVLARLWNGAARHAEGTDIGVVCLPKPGEEYCGDGYSVKADGSQERVLLADGLGHGPLAAAAADAAVAAFADSDPQQDPSQTLTFVHHVLRGTRGAAVAIADIDAARNMVHYAGVGNISASIIVRASGDVRHLISQNGTAGIEVRRVQQFSYPWSSGASLIMHSDGLATHWQLSRYPGLMARDPAIVAGVLYRDFRRGTDDVTVLVVRAPAVQ